ncbi:YncE family protein [Mycobacterium botniense]|uniref:Uncharacterized protein n=1 Tax=Mycobacterium botniense TaxID=84962 RepID=A0A7I9Y2G8_9MYCO|nr:YncE family protein [Mycobacterium botniense]GFG76266.1 hypothetical protein MBOT_36310 [Mycobacterium botniense]
MTGKTCESRHQAIGRGDSGTGPVDPAGALLWDEPDPGECAPVPRVVATIALAGRAGDVAVSPDSACVYVAQSNSVAVISRLNNITGIISACGHPKDLMFGIDGDRLYVTSYEGCVSVVDLADHRVGVIPGAVCAREVATTDQTLVYAAHNAKHDRGCSSWISVSTTQGVTVATIPGAGGCAIVDLAANPHGTRVYAACVRPSPYRQYRRGFVAVIDTAAHAVGDVIDLPAAPDSITVSPDGLTMYVTHEDTESVSAVNLATHCVTPIEPGDTPLAVTLTPDSLTAYVTGCCSLSVIDTVTNAAQRIMVGGLPRSVQISPDGKRAYVGNVGERTVSVIDTIVQCVVNTIDIGAYPHGLAISPDGSRLYVSDYWAGTVTVVSI